MKNDPRYEKLKERKKDDLFWKILYKDHPQYHINYEELKKDFDKYKVSSDCVEVFDVAPHERVIMRTLSLERP